MGDNGIISVEKYDDSVANELNDNECEHDLSTMVNEVYSDLLQDNGAPKTMNRQPIVSWLIKQVHQATNSPNLESNSTNTFSTIVIAVILLLAPLFILGFFGSADQDSSCGDILYRSILQLVDSIWSICMAPFDAVIRLINPASYSPLLVDEDHVKQGEAYSVPSPRRRILRSLVAKTQTMPPLVPIPGAQEKLPKGPNLKQPQPPPDLEPAFLNPEDYPPGWLVFHPLLGVVSKEEADAHDRDHEAQSTEKEMNTISEKQQGVEGFEEKDVSEEEMTGQKVSTTIFAN